MGQSFKAILQLVWLIGVFSSIFAWGVPQHPNQLDWALRFGGPLFVIGMMVLLLKIENRKDLLPDLLRERCGRYFERDGLCFSPKFEVIGGKCWLSVYFQNRYLGACESEILIRPGVKTLGITHYDAPELRVTIQCPGGGFGVARRSCNIPEATKGREVRYDLFATTRYFAGSQRLVRFRDGVRVGPVPSWVDTLAAGVVVAALGKPSRPARCRLVLPNINSGGDEVVPESVTQLLWTPATLQ